MGRNITEPGNETHDPHIKIQMAAEALFASRGFDGVSIRDIAEQAQVNISAIYYHYRNKNELYRNIVEGAYIGFAGELEETIQKGTDPIDRLERYFLALVSYLRKNINAAEIVFRGIFSRDTTVKQLEDQYGDKQVALLMGILREGIDAGLFCSSDVRLTAIAMRSAVLGYFLSYPIARRYPYIEGYSEELDDALARNILDLVTLGVYSRN